MIALCLLANASQKVSGVGYTIGILEKEDVKLYPL